MVITVYFYLNMLVLGTVLAGIVLNTLLLIALHRINTTRKSYFALIKSLILSDLLLPLSFIIIVVTGDFALYEYLLYAILVHLMLLVMEHYVAIIRPLHYVRWTRRRYIICRLVMGWIVPIVLVVISRCLPDKPITLRTKYFVETELIKTKDIFRIPFILGCFIGIVVVNIYMYKAVREQQRFHSFPNQHSEHNNKVLVVTILNVGTFFLCWFPVVVAEIWFHADGSVSYKTFYDFKDLKLFIQFVPLLNSICDPLIYAIRLRVVRKMWQKLFCCLCKKSLSQRVKARQISVHYCVSKNEIYLK